MSGETLFDIVARAKARWLKRVMYESTATSTQKCLAYAIADHLNCVTLDCWPAQATLARRLGKSSERTVRRLARPLSALRIITVRDNPGHRCGLRYGPVFQAADADKFALHIGQIGAEDLAANVPESFLPNPSISFLTKLPAQSQKRTSDEAAYRPARRGAVEIKLAARFGSRGLDVLGRLQSIDDAIIDRLCRAFLRDMIGERELTAARLAAEHVR